MENRYIDLIKQTFDFPQKDFRVDNNKLFFNDIDLLKIIEKHGAPLRVTYLPKISEQINKAKSFFKKAMEKLQYNADYRYCYCTKSSHFSYVLDEVLKNDVHIETSSSYDIDIINKLYSKDKISKDLFIIANGYKTTDYLLKLSKLINDGFQNVIPILDNKEEIDSYNKNVQKSFNIGIRIATDEEPNHEFYTSRLGIRYVDVKSFYRSKIEDNDKFKLTMLHFFMNTGIKDSAYYWSELNKCIKLYCELKKICPTLTSLNIGGGLPISYSLGFEYDYEYMIEEILTKVKDACEEENVALPNIFTEFGNFTVGESSAMIYSVIGEKQQNDNEFWYMIDNSFITTLPDTWGIDQRFIMFPINNWNNEYHKVNLGGLSCDSLDYYNAEAHVNQLFLPKLIEGEKLYIGFFHTGAYQEAVSGYGGIKHCLIPSPKHIVIDKDKNGKIVSKEFAPQQSAESMLGVLGY